MYLHKSEQHSFPITINRKFILPVYQLHDHLRNRSFVNKKFITRFSRRSSVTLLWGNKSFLPLHQVYTYMYYTVLYNAPRPPHLFRSLSKYLPCDSKARRVLRRIVRRIIYILLRDVLCHRPREKRKKGKKKETILKKVRDS